MRYTLHKVNLVWSPTSQSTVYRARSNPRASLMPLKLSAQIYILYTIKICNFPYACSFSCLALVWGCTKKCLGELLYSLGVALGDPACIVSTPAHWALSLMPWHALQYIFLYRIIHVLHQLLLTWVMQYSWQFYSSTFEFYVKHCIHNSYGYMHKYRQSV